MSGATVIPHIRLDDQGRPWIEGTTMKVIELVGTKVGFGWDAEELHRNLPHISLAQIHAALAYYYDHQAEMDAELERNRIEDEKLAAESAATASLRRKLRPFSKTTPAGG